jgi:hypothetical protein
MTATAKLPDEHDVIIWHLDDRDDLDVFRVTKGSTPIRAVIRASLVVAGVRFWRSSTSTRVQR